MKQHDREIQKKLLNICISFFWKLNWFWQKTVVKLYNRKHIRNGLLIIRFYPILIKKHSQSSMLIRNDNNKKLKINYSKFHKPITNKKLLKRTNLKKKLNVLVHKWQIKISIIIMNKIKWNKQIFFKLVMLQLKSTWNLQISKWFNSICKIVSFLFTQILIVKIVSKRGRDSLLNGLQLSKAFKVSV